MRSARFFIFVCIMVLMLAGNALAGQVRIFKAVEEGEENSPMEMQKTAMNEGFAQAVLDEALPMLPGALDEVRSELFREYLVDHAKPYIQGYKILSSEMSDAGLILVLDVRVNKKTLRPALKRMGLTQTVTMPQAASVVWPEDFDEESLARLQGLMTLTGIQAVQDALPSFSVEPGPEKTYKGRLEMEGREFVSINKDMATVWFSLWAHFFTRSDAAQAQGGVQKLSVSGWFSPDAVLEFDRVLKGWDSTLQDVALIELDMQPTGVGGIWEIRLLSGERLDMLLKSYLPQRGLSYQLSEASAK